MCTAVVGYVPEGNFKRWLNYNVSIMCFALLSGALSSVITYHNTEYRPMRGICVANHTSPIDVLVLMCDNCYSLVCLIATEQYEIDELNEKFISNFFICKFIHGYYFFAFFALSIIHNVFIKFAFGI